MQTYSAKSGGAIRLGADGNDPIENLPPVAGQPGDMPAVAAPAPSPTALPEPSYYEAVKPELTNMLLMVGLGTVLGAGASLLLKRNYVKGAVLGSLIGSTAATSSAARTMYGTNMWIARGLSAASAAGALYYAMK